MRRLMLLRHAKTENDAPSGRDQDRRLDDRGRKDAAEIGSFIANRRFPILCWFRPRPGRTRLGSWPGPR
jgi:phosphohistidine phosphatase SixA